MRIEVKAGFDPPELTRDDLERDWEAEIRKLLDGLEAKDAKTMEEEVYVKRRYDLCPPCRAAWLEDPFSVSPAP